MRQARELPPEFHLDVEPERSVARVCPIGELDMGTVGAVAAELERLRVTGFRNVVLDLREATFLDSTGLRLVLAAQRASSRDGWEFGVIQGPAAVQRTFELTGTLGAVRFVDA